jgi:hypothetical protein
MYRNCSRWIALSKKSMQKELSYKLLFEKLEALDRAWHTSTPSREETESLRESFDIFIKYCFDLISNLRDIFVSTPNHGIDKLEYILRYN